MKAPSVLYPLPFGEYVRYNANHPSWTIEVRLHALWKLVFAEIGEPQRQSAKGEAAASLARGNGRDSQMDWRPAAHGHVEALESFAILASAQQQRMKLANTAIPGTDTFTTRLRLQNPAQILEARSGHH